MSTPTIARLRVAVNGGDGGTGQDGGEYHVSMLRVNMAINTIPTATMTVARQAGGQLHRPVDEEIIAVLREKQTARLAGRSAPDTHIVASDGIGGTLVFNGYLAVPVLETARTGTADQFTVLGADTALDGLDLSIYLVGATGARSDENPNGLKPIAAAGTGNVPQMLSDITDVLVSNYNGSLANVSGVGMQALLAAQHTLNLGVPLNTWREILRNSDAIYESWGKAFGGAGGPSMARHMSERTRIIMCQKTSGFWGVLNNLMASYQMFYRPNTEGAGGLFLSSLKTDDTKTATLDVHATSLNVSDGSSRIMQPGGVVMTAGGQTGMRGAENVAPPHVVAAYPNPLRPGYIHRDVPPAWLVDENGIPILGTEFVPATGITPVAVDLSLIGLQTRLDDADTHSVKVRESLTNVMTELCKVMFEDLQIADSTASITIPLNFNAKLGERVEFRLVSGGTFNGFVAGLTHTIDLRRGKELDSFTQLSITHARY